MNKYIYILLSSFLFLSCAGVEVNNCENVIEINHISCEEFDYIPTSSSNIFIKASYIVPNPTDGQYQKMMLVNYSQSEMEIEPLFLNTFKYDTNTIFRLIDFTSSLNNKSTINPCDSIIIEFDLNNIITKSNGSYRFWYRSKEKEYYIQNVYYEDVKPNEKFYLD